MGKLAVVKNDRVEGTDKHNVTGLGPNPAAPPPTATYKGIGDFDYVGKMSDQLSDFVSINGKVLALTTSKSSLNPGENAPGGKHFGSQGKNFVTVDGSIATTPTAVSLSITDTIGEGKPSANAGSNFVTVDGVAILLDGDKIDTCDGIGKLMNSTVTVENQDFVFCSE
jgi:uncharacterized Zn-binding protein involved in type VI secretion